MTNASQPHELNKALVEINKTIVDWLKFAEAKNAGLLAGNLAVIFGIARIDSLASATAQTFAWFYLWNIVVFCGLSAVLCLISIVPQVRIPLMWARRGDINSDLVFFGSIATHTRDTYIGQFESATQTKLSQLDRDLAGQIVVNSRIAQRKFFSFKWSAWLTLSAFITPIAAAWLMFTREK